MSSDWVQVTGLKESIDMLKNLPASIGRPAISKALEEAAVPLRDQIKANILHSRTGDLMRSIAIIPDTKIRKDLNIDAGFYVGLRKLRKSEFKRRKIARDLKFSSTGRGFKSEYRLVLQAHVYGKFYEFGTKIYSGRRPISKAFISRGAEVVELFTRNLGVRLEQIKRERNMIAG